MAKTLKIDMNHPGESGKTYTKNAKGATTIEITYDGTVSSDNFTKTNVSGSTLSLKLCDQWTYKLKNLSNPDDIQVVIKKDDGTEQYNDTLQNFYDYMSGDIATWTYDNKKGTVTGSIFSDDIDVSNEEVFTSKKGYKINANAGGDTIIGTKYNDTFTGGTGENTIIYDRTKTETFGADTVKLTKGENLTLDLSALNMTEKQFKDALSVSGSNLLVKLTEDETINLATFAKSANAEVDVLLKKAVGVNPAKIVHLNTDEIFTYTDEAFTVNNKKQTATLSTTRFADKITVEDNDGYTKTIKAGDGLNNISVESKGKLTITTGKDADTISVENNNKNVTINVGNGENEITLTDAYATNTVTGGKDKDTLELIRCGDTTAKLGDGENEVRIFNSVVNATSTIISGKDNDTINLDWNKGSTVVKAGKGVNTINIQDQTFGNVTIAEEKVKATNIINFTMGEDVAIDSTFTYTRDGNDLIIRNDKKDAKLTVSGYYLTRTAKTKYAEIKFQVNGVDKTLDELLANATATITGKGALEGTDGNDIFYNTSANNTITGKKGINTVVFDGAFGKDSINLTEGERLVIDMSKYEYADECNISYSIKGDDLTITAYENPHKAYGTLTLKGFAKSDITGGGEEAGVQAGVFLKLSDTETIDLRAKEYDIDNVKSSFTGSWLNEYINPATVKKPIVLEGGKGDDHINSSNKPTTFVFNSGDGNDTVYDTKDGDIIQINAVGEPDYVQDGNDLVIRYGEGDTLRVDGYYYSYYMKSRIDTIKIKQEDGSYLEQSLESITHASEMVGEIFKTKGGTEFIQKDDPYTTIEFNGGNTFSYGAGNDPEQGMTADDLVISYDAYNDWSKKVVIKGYISGESNVKNMLVWTGGRDELFEIPYHVGTDGDDEFGTTKLYQEHYYLKGGNDTIKFDAEFGQENDIHSVGTKATTTDTLEFKDYSFEDGELTFNRWNDGNLTINNNTERYDSNRVTYVNYFSDDTPEINVVDKNGSIDIKTDGSATAVDWSEDTQNHVLFVDNHEGQFTKSISSNAKANYIEVASDNTTDNYSTKLDYTYNGGNDVVSTSDYYANDKYTVSSFTANSKLMIEDNGGDDKLIINANSSDMYMLFNANKMTYSEDVSVYESNRAFVHKDAFNLQTLKDYLTSAPFSTTVNGLVKLTSEIETVETNDDTDLDYKNWETYIGRRVGAWIEKNGLVGDGSLQRILSNPEQYGITDEKLADLLECYRVSFEDVPVDQEMSGTTGSDTFVLGKANNTITINNPTLGLDTIESTADFRIEDYKDRIEFSGSMGYQYNYGSTLSVELNGNDLVIGKTDDLDNNSITYVNFATDTCRNDLILKDSLSREYGIHAVTNGVSFANNTNNIAFVDVTNSSYPGINSSNGENYIYSTGEHHNTYDDRVTGIWYGYNGGTDTIVTNSETASDTYSISQFTTTSKWSIVDNGGDDDYIILGTQWTSQMGNTRFVFDISNEGEIDYSEFKFVHKDALSGNKLRNAMTDDLTDGVLEFKMATTAGKFGMESVAFNYDWDKGDYEYADLNAWADEIASGVQGWLTAHNDFTSAYDAFENCKDADALADLVACYNVDYTQLNQG